MLVNQCPQSGSSLPFALVTSVMRVKLNWGVNQQQMP